MMYTYTVARGRIGVGGAVKALKRLVGNGNGVVAAHRRHGGNKLGVAAARRRRDVS